MGFLRVKNWERFQHYGQRTSPPWIKLHRSVLIDFEFRKLPDKTKAFLMLLWILAGQNDGIVHDDVSDLRTVLGLDEQPDLEILISKGFLIPCDSASARPWRSDSNLLNQDASPRALAREETEKTP